MPPPNVRVVRSEGDFDDLGVAAANDIDVYVAPGIPGYFGTDPMELHAEGPVYPSSTIDFMKLLRENGTRIAFADDAKPHTLVTHKAADVWLPIMVFVGGVATAALGNILSAVILEFLTSEPDKAVLHVKVGRSRKDSKRVDWIEAHGPAASVTDVVKEFLQDS